MDDSFEHEGLVDADLYVLGFTAHFEDDGLGEYEWKFHAAAGE
ncbi:hypothetical protein ANO14919_116930 [Xylariales sp. No.14919]|nr:hypothetical protein ANO14919_116930 [Xylariales sp. No.14919]